jgi:citrate lyase subunit beta/citryl-CoA lyase
VKPYRSLLFVPGHKADWVNKAVAAKPDAVILDLEDAVPVAEKERARDIVRESIQRLAAERSGVGVVVRINALSTGRAGEDIAATAIPGLDGYFIPKVTTAEDVIRLDALTDHFERVNGAPPKALNFILATETAEAVANCAETARAPRVAALVGGGARGADQARALGFRWTGTGLETIYIRSQVVVACRAAGNIHPLCSIWQDIRDFDGLRAWSNQNRDLGFRGQVLIHPSHVAVANEVFAPSAQEVDFAREMVAAFTEAEERGDAAISFRGQHIDYAHVETARELLMVATELSES